jgi:polyisoprenoid-binding protein YceI
MSRYAIDSRASRVVVRATSAVHDTTCTWSRVSGAIEADPANLAAATAAVHVDMAAFDAGDFLKNRKLKTDMDVAANPTASFTLGRLRDLAERAGGRFSALAEGTLCWRGREVALTATGEGTIDGGIRATARFQLDVRDVGMTPPRFLMLKVEEIVAVEVTIVARADEPTSP